MLCMLFISSVIFQSCRIIVLKLVGVGDTTLVVDLLIGFVSAGHNVCACMIFRNDGGSSLTVTVLIH